MRINSTGQTREQLHRTWTEGRQGVGQYECSQRNWLHHRKRTDTNDYKHYLSNSNSEDEGTLDDLNENGRTKNTLSFIGRDFRA